jgi:2-keto-4-pentenoate hydratase/2-oxohepta-3-ene-1,7-dioic acid hydratase in catechol pathway
MILGRFRYGKRVLQGIVEDNEVMVTSGKLKGRRIALERLRVLTPSRPTKIVCVGLNYKDHAAELGMPLPSEPVLFLKPPSAALAHREAIVYPSMAKRVDYEAELGVVISRRCRNVSAKEVERFILGYTCFNDVTARDLQQRDGQWTRAKSFDTFAPFGPYVVTPDEVDVAQLEVKLYLNRRLKQRGSTKNMIFPVEELISFISRIMTLERGDVIATGTPPGVGPMKPGDEVVVEIPQVGRLVNRVTEAK